MEMIIAMSTDWYGQQQKNGNNSSLMAVPVQGEVGAQNYLVASGNTVLLTDFNSDLIWIKSNDGFFRR